MAGPLQRFDFRSSGYERPNQGWVCGRRAAGRPCELGPLANGVCRGGFECHPLKNGDRWSCTRQQSSGGKCADGPLPDGTCCLAVIPCRPVRTQGRLLRALNFWAVAIAVGLIFAGMAFGPDVRNALLTAGPLSASHAAINDCRSCHGFDDNGMTSLIVKAVHGDPHKEAGKACASCHAPEATGDAHNLPRAALDAISGRLTPDTSTHPALTRMAGFLGAAPHPEDAVVPAGGACLSCHTEHKGRSGNLSPVSNDTCNRCHVRKFAGVSDGHPDFRNYPHTRRQRLRFNHETHLTKHFEDPRYPKSAPRQCTGCHRDDSRRGLMTTGGFDKTCGGCHGKDFKDLSVMLLAIPGIDLETLSEKGGRIGEWPDGLDVEYLPALMKLLLSHDDGFRSAYAALREAELPLLDLGDATVEQIRHVETFAWSIKKFIAAQAVSRATALAADTGNRYGQGSVGPHLDSFAGHIASDPFVALQKAYFPNLMQELRMKEAGEAPKTAPVEPADAGAEAKPNEFFVDFGAVFYNFNNHRAVAPVRSVIEIALNAHRSKPDSFSEEMAETVSSKDFSGRCLACHSTDFADDAADINWQGARQRSVRSSLTAFSHAPHILGAANMCGECHKIAKNARFSETYVRGDPTKFESGFRNMSVDVCAKCHSPESAGDSCKTCHVYHASAPAVMERGIVKAGRSGREN
jgi:hypothetical protein